MGLLVLFSFHSFLTLFIVPVKSEVSYLKLRDMSEEMVVKIAAMCTYTFTDNYSIQTEIAKHHRNLTITTWRVIQVGILGGNHPSPRRYHHHPVVTIRSDQESLYLLVSYWTRS